MRIGILLGAAALMLAGCASNQPINNVVNAPLVYPQGKSLTMGEVSKAVVAAGTGLGWQMQPTAPGKISGRLVLRTHVAEVDVEHNTKSYSIKYRDSQNLEARDGMIHKAYNGWIENLDKAIRSNVEAAAGGSK
jgi:hypothetical protein